MDIQKENVDFGDYCSIEQKRHGVENEFYGYKVVNRLRSNAWIDVPVDAQNSKPNLHDETVDVVEVISCTVGSEVVECFRVSDLARAWNARASVPEGFVLIEKSKIKTYWQDGDESENIVYSLNDLDDLGDYIGDDEIIEVNQISYAHTSELKKFGVWKVQMIDEHGDVLKNFVLANSRDDAEKVIQANSAIHAEYQAQEPSND